LSGGDFVVGSVGGRLLGLRGEGAAVVGARAPVGCRSSG